MLHDSLKALARYAPIFEKAGFSWGRWHNEPGGMPYLETSAEAEAFIQDAYRCGWVMKEFDWSSWIGSEEAGRLRTELGAVETATAEQLGMLLTCYVRGERFTEGVLAEAYDAGLLTRIARRAARLIDAV